MTIKQLELMMRGLLDEMIDKKLDVLIEAKVLKVIKEQKLPNAVDYAGIRESSTVPKTATQGQDDIAARYRKLLQESYNATGITANHEQFDINKIPDTTPIQGTGQTAANFASTIGTQPSILEVPTNQLPTEVATALTKNYGPLMNRVIKKR